MLQAYKATQKFFITLHTIIFFPSSRKNIRFFMVSLFFPSTPPFNAKEYNFSVIENYLGII